VVLAVLIFQGVCLGATSLEGYTEFFGEVNGESRRWRFSTPQYLAELRFMSTPWSNTEMYLKTQAYSNRWDNDTWENFLMVREAHLKFRSSRIESYLFFGQDRFWLGEPLLNIVSNDIIKDDDYGPKAQGIRVDFWDLWGITGSGFFSDKSTTYPATYWPEFPAGPDYARGGIVSSDDYRGFRIKRSFLGSKSLLGATYARKEYGSSRDDFDETFAVDVEANFGDIIGALKPFGLVTLIGEAGKNVSVWTGDDDPMGWKLELRGVGYKGLSFIGNVYDYDNKFYTVGLARGDHLENNGHGGHYLQLDYRVPLKEINLKVWRYRYKPHDDTIDPRPREENGIQAWIRFVRNFTGLVEYKRHINKDGSWPNLFFMIQGENRLVRIRAQYRIKDLDTRYEINAYGFEANANLTERWKLYTRILTVDEKTEARETVFAQIQYTGWSSADFFVEFGDGGASWDLANSDDFVNNDSNQVTTRVFKAFMRLYY
jgi:hypothetical protein